MAINIDGGQRSLDFFGETYNKGLLAFVANNADTKFYSNEFVLL